MDVIEIGRIERVLSRTGDRFILRVFTEAEAATCLRARRPAPHFAVRFAAKEAVMKAVGTGWAKGVRFGDIETRPTDASARAAISDRLEVVLHGSVRERVAAMGGDRLHLAVSLNRTHATAVALIEAVSPRDPGAGSEGAP